MSLRIKKKAVYIIPETGDVSDTGFTITDKFKTSNVIYYTFVGNACFSLTSVEQLNYEYVSHVLV